MRRYIIAAVAVLVGARLAPAQDHQHHDHAEPRPAAHESAEAATLTNPVPADRMSLLEGRQIYEEHCASCHGADGRGDGRAGATLRPRPSDLTDATWTHGASDGDIFIVVRDGARQTAMRGFGGKLNTRELWSIVNYLRTIGPPTPSP